MSMFVARALRKTKEHFRHDKTGLTFLRYALKLLAAKTKRRLGAGLTVAKPAFAEPDAGVVRVSVEVAGGIGDYVVIARAIRDLSAQSSGVRFHVFCPFVSVGEWVFGSLACVERVLEARWFAGSLAHYDCALHMNQYVYLEEAHYNRDKLGRLAPSLLHAVEHCRKTRSVWGPYIASRPLRDGESARLFVAQELNRYGFLQSQLGIAPGSLKLDIACDYDTADDLAGRYGRWVTINTGFDANLVMAAQLPVKCYPTESWTQLVSGFKHRYPDIAVIAIGAKTSVPIDGVDENLVGRTTLAQAAGVLRRSLLHVDCDGGLVHIASALGVKSVAMFGPTPWRYFGYPGNVNVSSGYCGDCWWTSDGWMERCPAGYATAKCMDALAPSRVLDAVGEALNDSAYEDSTKMAEGPYALPQSMGNAGGTG